MTPTQYTLDSPDGLFGSSMLEEDLFAFTGTQSTPITTTTSDDFAHSLMSHIIDNADPSVTALFDDASMQSVFTSLFPDAKPVAPVPVQTAELLLANAEAQLHANPGMAQTVKRVRQSLAAMAPLVSPAMSSLTSVSPQMAGHATPLFGFEDFAGFGNVSPVSSDGSPLLMSTDGFASAWNLAAGQISPSGDSASEEKPKSKAGRKRKERPNDPEQLLQELDLKRQRNTESARRSRVKRMAVLDQLHIDLTNAVEGEKKALEKIKTLEAELERARQLLAMAGAQLKATGL